MKKAQWIAVALTGVVIVLLLVAPKHSGKFEDKEAQAETTPPDVEYRIDSALALINGEQPMQGILLLRSIADEEPGNFRAQYNLGQFSAQTGQWEKVLERFEIVQKIDPSFGESNYWMGLAHFNLGNQSEAKKSLEQFVSNKEENIELINDAQTMLNQIK